MSGFSPDGPDHCYSPGCCEQDRHFHEWSPEESREIGEWMNTEPGMIMRLENRRRALRRLLDLGAPEVILGIQRQMIREMEQKLGLRREHGDPGNDSGVDGGHF